MKEVAEAHRQEWGRVLAATTRVTRDLDLAEEFTQDAFAQALRTWPESGVPDRPGAWLTTVARNRALDFLRREAHGRRSLPLLVPDDAVPGPEQILEDDLLRLVFTCCHPALSRDAQVSLTLRLVCGLSTSDVARAFLVQESTMAARITRAKKKIAAAGIPYRVPPPDQLVNRLVAVLEVLHLIFTTGHTAPSGTELVRRDLVDCAIGLTRTLRLLMPGTADVSALLALFLLVEARSATRIGADGRLLLLSEQDRGRWDRDLINEGIAALTDALTRASPSRYAVEAALAAVHAESASWEATDWSGIIALYDVLRASWPSPVADLNRAVAIGMRDGPAAGLQALEPLAAEPALASYHYLSAIRADFLRRLGRTADALLAYEEALALADNEVEREFLLARQAALRATG
ncbi:sigma-70 family RNA polymerase sigma factor [Kribbella sp. NBC_01505]|uniref:RNA polymerase sigma factor n=1 Tax=Kribbella sp. NBC_01505 TaxID=2903580 RepID=UPI00386EBCC6